MREREDRQIEVEDHILRGWVGKDYEGILKLKMIGMRMSV